MHVNKTKFAVLLLLKKTKKYISKEIYCRKYTRTVLKIYYLPPPPPPPAPPNGTMKSLKKVRLGEAFVY